MINTIRCCISCILPCGALDVIRIVHVNGRVEEITGTIYASEILKDHPKHILKKPTTKPISEDYIETTSAHHRPTIVVVPPHAQLQRGKIYFLIPVIDSSKRSQHSVSKSTDHDQAVASCVRRRRREEEKLLKKVDRSDHHGNNNGNSYVNKDDDKYLSDLLSEKVLPSQKEKRRGRVAVWRPHLESINETFSDTSSNDQ